jgi:hypothetical protein
MVLRLRKAVAAAADKWAAARGMTRSAAIRKWIEEGLGKRRRSSKASVAASEKMAANAIDRIGDQAANPDEREERKRRLLRGPVELRETHRGQLGTRRG